MKALAALLMAAMPLSAAYQYYYADTFPPYSPNPTYWAMNGQLNANNGITISAATGGALVSKIAVPDGTASYEVKTTLGLKGNGGIFTTYMRASNDALEGANSGTYYAVELQNPTFNGGACTATFAVNERVNGVVTTLLSTPVTCHDGMVIRTVYASDSRMAVYIDGKWVTWFWGTDISIGQPGVGVRNAPSENVILEADLGPCDRVAPNPVNLQALGYSAFPNRVDFQWQNATDDPNGSGVAMYGLFRNGDNLFFDAGTGYTDPAVAAGTTYAYQLCVYDYHLNAVCESFNVTTPPAGDIDPRQVGVRPLGSYWGGAGEQIDMRSGNLNYSIPLLKAMSRGGGGVQFNLSYNSENWRQGSGGTWQVGHDIGYGYGFTLQAGSLTPYWSYFSTLDHYVFTDATGAQYRLDQNSGGVWTSKEGIYLAYDSNTNRLYFKDGSFWIMDCTSAGTEQDAGTMYPTTMEDTNGNEIWIGYEPGVGVTWSNSSGRIALISDIRKSSTFTFTYNTDPIPHLTQITNNVGTAEQYTFTYSENLPLAAPFSPYPSFGTTTALSFLAQNTTNQTTGFYYGTEGSSTTGELTEVTTPGGGHLRWDYTNYAYYGALTQREVYDRYLSMSSGAPELAYTVVHETFTPSTPVHQWTVVNDVGANSGKAWWFQVNGTQFNLGLPLWYEDRLTPWDGTGGRHVDYTWTQDGVGNPYISQSLISADYTEASQVQSKTVQTLDNWGNVTQDQVYNWGASSPSRTYTNTFVTDSNYTGRYIHNLLLSSTVTDGTNTATLVTNTYDGGSLAASSAAQHDAAYSTAFPYRGNPTSTITPSGTVTRSYDITGMTVGATDGYQLNVSVTPDTATNSLPAAITPNSTQTLTSSYTYTTALALSTATQPNNSTSQIQYDSIGRPQTSTSPYGAQTTFSYVTGPPATVTSTVNGRWARQTLDGFGRVVKVERGTASGTLSVVDTVYGACGCSPLGKVVKVSQPYVPGGTEVYTSYTYDGLGRLSTSVAPDGASTTTHSHWSNVEQVTDAAGNWKQYVRDVFGNVIVIREPNPAAPNDRNQDHWTYYGYDVLNHLTSVSMPRNGTTQTRTFNYNVGTMVTGRLQSATNPETGTVSYTYNPNGTLAARTDAKGQHWVYQYDTLNRLTSANNQSNSTGTDNIAYWYDNNTNEPGWAQNTAGRLTWVRHMFPNNDWFMEEYSYSPAGEVVAKRLQVRRALYTGYSAAADADVLYTYDNEGRVATETFPGDGPYAFTYDGLGRLASGPYFNSVQYGPADELLSFFVGGTQPYTETRQYNNLLQLTRITVPGVVDMQYNYSTTQNNGQILSEQNLLSGEQVNYQYDALNRLMQAVTSDNPNVTQWGQSFTYDGFGNLTQKNVIKNQAPSLAVIVDPATNRVTQQGGSAISYDANGNPTVAYGPGGTMGLTYDGQNRLIKAGNDSYAYDPAGHREWKLIGPDQFYTTGANNDEFYMYDMSGHRVGTYKFTATINPPQGYFAATERDYWFGSRLIYRWTPGGAGPVMQDRLGSVRADSGVASDFYPYGEEKGTATANDRVKFGTYRRDGDTGLDYAENRYYSSALGRFLRPDPWGGSASVTNPQSWNRYAYVLNDPARWRDSTGLGTGADDCTDMANSCGPNMLLGSGLDGGGSTGPVNYSSSDVEGTVLTDQYGNITSDPNGTPTGEIGDQSPSNSVTVGGTPDPVTPDPVTNPNDSLRTPGFGQGSPVVVPPAISSAGAAPNKGNPILRTPSKNQPYLSCVGKTAAEDAVWGAVGTGVIVVVVPTVGFAVGGSGLGPEGTFVGAGLGFALGVAIAPGAAIDTLILGGPVGLIHGLIGCAFE